QAFVRSTPVARSSPNVVTVDPLMSFFDERHGTIQAQFSQPMRSVSIDARSVEAPEGFGFVDRAFLSAYDSSGALIATTQNSVTETWETLTIVASDIRSVQFSATRTSGRPFVYGLFDNLSFTATPAERSWRFVSSMPTARWALGAATGPDGL